MNTQTDMQMIQLCVLLTQGRVMVVKKKTAKVEAVVFDEEELHKLIGNMAELLMN